MNLTGIQGNKVKFENDGGNTNGAAQIQQAQNELASIFQEQESVNTEIETKETEIAENNEQEQQQVQEITDGLSSAQSDFEAAHSAFQEADSTASSAESNASALTAAAESLPKEIEEEVPDGEDANGNPKTKKVKKPNPAYLAAKAEAEAAKAQADELRNQANSLKEQEAQAQEVCNEIIETLGELESEQEEKEQETEEKDSELETLKEQYNQFQERVEELNTEIEQAEQEAQQEEKEPDEEGMALYESANTIDGMDQRYVDNGDGTRTIINPDGTQSTVAIDEETGNIAGITDNEGNSTTYQFSTKYDMNNNTSTTVLNKSTTNNVNDNSTTITEAGKDGKYDTNKYDSQGNNVYTQDANKDETVVTSTTDANTGIKTTIDENGNVTYKDENGEELDSKDVRERRYEESIEDCKPEEPEVSSCDCTNPPNANDETGEDLNIGKNDNVTDKDENEEELDSKDARERRYEESVDDCEPEDPEASSCDCPDTPMPEEPEVSSSDCTNPPCATDETGEDLNIGKNDNVTDKDENGEELDSKDVREKRLEKNVNKNSGYISVADLNKEDRKKITENTNASEIPPYRFPTTEEEKKAGIEYLTRSATNENDKKFIEEALNQLPQEVVNDLLVETNGIAQMDKYAGVCIKDASVIGADFKYDNGTYTENSIKYVITHELGHMVDTVYDGKTNESALKTLVDNDEEFNKIYHEELQNFFTEYEKEAGEKFPWDALPEYKENEVNPTEIFATYYVYKMLGDSDVNKEQLKKSKNYDNAAEILTAMMPETVKAMDKIIEENRSKSIKERNINYNKDTLVNNYDSNGKPIGYTVNKFNTEGNISSAESYNTQGTKVSETINEYSNGKISKTTEKHYDKDGNIKVIRNYDETGKLDNYVYLDDVSNENFVDENGNEIKYSTQKSTYNPDGTVQQEEVLDEKGNVRLVRNYDENGRLENYIYIDDVSNENFIDSKGNEIKYSTQKSTYGPDGNKRTEELLDEKGNVRLVRYYDENGKLDSYSELNECGELENYNYFDDNAKYNITNAARSKEILDANGNVKIIRNYDEDGRLKNYVYIDDISNENFVDENGNEIKYSTQKSTYNPDGTVQQEEVLDEKGNVRLVRNYDENGKLDNYVYLDDVSNENFVDENGNEEKYSTQKTTYDPNGNKQTEELLDGNGNIKVIRNYDENGKLDNYVYLDDVSNENFVDENGNEVKYSTQKTTYNPNGNKQTEELLDGNGNIKVIRNYDENGELDSYCEYDENGNLINKKEFNKK